MLCWDYKFISSNAISTNTDELLWLQQIIIIGNFIMK